MGKQYKSSINNLSSQLDERMDKLKKAMNGKKLNSDFNSSDDIESFSFVNPSEVRVAVDDFNTILKEIKRELK